MTKKLVVKVVSVGLPPELKFDDLLLEELPARTEIWSVPNLGLLHYELQVDRFYIVNISNSVRRRGESILHSEENNVKCVNFYTPNDENDPRELIRIIKRQIENYRNE